MNELQSYAESLVSRSGKTLKSGEIFAKILTSNDDAGRHGVLVPSDVYSFFPNLPISDPSQNATKEFPSFDATSSKEVRVAYKYYQRYPERRITRLHGLINDRTNEPRLVVFLNAHLSDGTSKYYFDCANSAPDGNFKSIFNLLFGRDIPLLPGHFIVRPVDSAVFTTDSVLEELLDKFDEISSRGWIDSLREGDTGIGYTFETLMKIKENNDKTADFNGIEIKCKGLKEGKNSLAGKINLFQAGPVWLGQLSAKERIKKLGKKGSDGLYGCHSQVTTTSNNLGLLLRVLIEDRQIYLQKNAEAVGYWPFDLLDGRLSEKHSRAVFVKAATRSSSSRAQFRYEELVYCEKPSIDRFMSLVMNRNIVFEFLMSEKRDGTVRNHGYPWRIVREEFLEYLFSFQVKLR